MNTFRDSLQKSCIALFLLTLLLGIAYPLFMCGVGELFFHPENHGQVVYHNNQAIGSRWIGQPFSSSVYFHPRASANEYDGTDSGASNLGPTSQKLIDTIQARSDAYRNLNNIPSNTPIPADAVTASGSGLDPHISIANALLQAPRIAAARNIPLPQVHTLINLYTRGRWFGILGEPHINVLMINLALDKGSTVEP